MKANEAKSKFVYPDKLYARTNDNITLDISYAPQTLEAVEYTRTDAFVEKAAGWLSKHAKKYYFNKEKYLGTDELVEDFKIAMKL